MIVRFFMGLLILVFFTPIYGFKLVQNSQITTRNKTIMEWYSRVKEPLTDDDKNQRNKFSEAVKEKVPLGILMDLASKSIGFREGVPREYSDEEKRFLKTHIKHLPLLGFLQFVNLSDLGLETIPDEFSKLYQLLALTLDNNKLKQIPAAVRAIQKFNYLCLIDMTYNLIPDEVLNKHTRSVIDMVTAKNIYSVYPLSDLTWSSVLSSKLNLKKSEIDSHQVSTDDYAALFEFAFYKTTLGDKLYSHKWFKDVKNRVRLHHALQSKPEQVFSFAIQHPEKMILAPYDKKDQKQIIDVIFKALLSYLSQIDKVHIKHKPSTTAEGNILLRPEAVFGWRTYFTEDILPQTQDFWLTVNGVRALFDSFGLLADNELKYLSDAEQAQYLAFADGKNIPIEIASEIKKYKKIGYKENYVRPLTQTEKAWVKKYLDDIPDLSFLIAVNLSGLELSKLPRRFGGMQELCEINLSDNLFTSVPTCFLEMYKHSFVLGMIFQNNPIPDAEFKNFSRKVEEKEYECKKKHLVKKSIDIRSLQWNPLFIQALKFGPLVPFEWHQYQGSEAEVKARIRKYELCLFEFLLNCAAEFDMLIQISKATAAKTDIEALRQLEGRYVQAMKDNQDWLDDDLHRILLYSYMATHTPQDFIKEFSNINVMGQRIAAERNLRDDLQLTSDDIKNECVVFHAPVYTSLYKQQKVVELNRTVDDINGKEKITKNIIGWESYFTNEPSLDKKGWFKEKGIAEIMLLYKTVVEES